MPKCLIGLLRLSVWHEDAWLITSAEGVSFPREIVAYAVWAYPVALSTLDVEDLLAERGIIVSREAVRL